MITTSESWDFITTHIPDFTTRPDTLRQSELQLFIDGHPSSISGITREEAIEERDRILFRLYGEAIAAHTHSTPEQKALNEKLNEILRSDAACNRLGEFLIDETSADSESLLKVGRNVIEAYQNGDVDSMLVAICGRTMKSLVEKSE